MSGDFEGEAAELIPANVRMISGCQDSQTSADVSNVSAFSLPDPAGKSGGACTSALLKVLYNESGSDMSFVQVLTRMREILNKGKYTQIPALSSSRKMDVNDKFELSPVEARMAQSVLFSLVLIMSAKRASCLGAITMSEISRNTFWKRKVSKNPISLP